MAPTTPTWTVGTIERPGHGQGAYSRKPGSHRTPKKECALGEVGGRDPVSEGQALADEQPPEQAPKGDHNHGEQSPVKKKSRR